MNQPLNENQKKALDDFELIASRFFVVGSKGHILLKHLSEIDEKN